MAKNRKDQKVSASKRTARAKKNKQIAVPNKVGEELLDKKKKALKRAKVAYQKHAREFIELWSKVRRAQRGIGQL